MENDLISRVIRTIGKNPNITAGDLSHILYGNCGTAAKEILDLLPKLVNWGIIFQKHGKYSMNK